MVQDRHDAASLKQRGGRPVPGSSGTRTDRRAPCSEISYFELMGFGPSGWGAALLLAARHDASRSPAAASSSARSRHASWPGRSSRAASSPARSPTATRRSCAASRTSSSSTCSISAAARRSAPSARLFGARASSACRPSSTGALAIGIVSGAYQAEVFRGAYQALSPGRARGGALRRHAALADVPPHRRAAGAALRHPRPRQRLAARPQGIGADLRHRPRRAPAPVADRRRLDAPAVRLLHHGGGALSRHHLASRRAASSGPRRARCAASGGPSDGLRLHGRDLHAPARRACR